ncbi:hypothetical protein RYX36_027209 [Vicia faba]
MIDIYSVNILQHIVSMNESLTFQVLHMYAEIDPEFMRKYNDELSKSWTMLNNQGVHQEVIFNKVRDHPMIMSGWPFLEAYYDLPYEFIVEIGYYGNNNFGIHGFNEVSKCYTTLPHFHNTYMFGDDIHAFNLILSPIFVFVPKLVEYW